MPLEKNNGCSKISHCCRYIVEAWNVQRLHASPLNVEELLKHMYEACQELGLMEDLLKFNFTNIEQEYLHRFLQTSGGVQNQELLLVHHLQRANYIPALQLNQSLKTNHMNDCDRRLRERAVARNSILDQYGKILPRVQRTLANERAKPYSLSSLVWREVSRYFIFSCETQAFVYRGKASCSRKCNNQSKFYK
ncbi:hypothetical protein FKM82_019741 [Ascaphus truei]